MYCPKCGMQTTDSAAFCRSCGTDLGIVTQALTGALVPADEYDRKGKKRKKPATMTEGISTLSSGLGFIAAAIATLFYAPAGEIWWYWLLIPAFACIGSGTGMLIEVKKRQAQVRGYQLAAPAATTNGLPSAQPHSIAAPPSVVESTTRQLDGRHDIA